LTNSLSIGRDTVAAEAARELVAGAMFILAHKQERKQ